MFVVHLPVRSVGDPTAREELEEVVFEIVGGYAKSLREMLESTREDSLPSLMAARRKCSTLDFSESNASYARDPAFLLHVDSFILQIHGLCISFPMAPNGREKKVYRYPKLSSYFFEFSPIFK